MTELELQKILEQEIEIPSMVEEHIQKACAQAKPAPRTVRRSRRPLRTALVAAAVVAVLGISAAAGAAINRGPIYQALFGTKGISQIEAEEQYNEYGMMTARYVNEERLPADEELAEALVGDYLQQEPVVWTVGDYTVTVESWLIDEHTGTGKLFYTVECPSGIVGITVDEKTGHIFSNGEGIYLNFSILGGETSGVKAVTGYRTYIDLENSTPKRMALVTSLARAAGSWTAADGIEFRFGDFRNDEVDENGMVVRENEPERLILPGTSSVPAVQVEDPETGEPVAELSTLGMRVWWQWEIEAELDYVALTYADGSQYVVLDDAGETQNTSYEMWDGPDGYNDPETGVFVQTDDGCILVCCFNRLVDPEQVVAVTVNGTTYAVK